MSQLGHMSRALDKADTPSGESGTSQTRRFRFGPRLYLQRQTHCNEASFSILESASTMCLGSKGFPNQ